MRLTKAMHNQNRQRGAVSLFIVIFATMLMTVVTISFMRLMIQNQQEASAQDLSQSAYDSAQAGVQDAERALLRYEACQQGGSCSAADTSTWQNCNGIITSQLDPTQPVNIPEVPVSQTGDGQTATSNLQQAYTCVKVALNTDNVVGTIDPLGQRLIPISGVSNFTTIEVDWFTRDDLGAAGGANNYQVDLQNPATTPLPLLQQYNSVTKQGWSPSRPSVLRVQLIQYSANNGFTLSNFDNTNGSGQSDSNTVFLYPTGFSGSNPSGYTPQTLPFGVDARRVPTGAPYAASCLGDLSGGGYSCSELLTLPTPINGGNRTAYLRISPLYNATHFQVKLLATNNQSSVVQFQNVQPSIDSTGRANDLFRRVVTRVDLLNDNLPYPSDAVELTGPFCKDFAVTNDPTQYQSINTSSCKP